MVRRSVRWDQKKIEGEGVELKRSAAQSFVGLVDRTMGGFARADGDGSTTFVSVDRIVAALFRLM